LQLCADGGYQLRIRSLEGTPNYGPRQFDPLDDPEMKEALEVINMAESIVDEVVNKLLNEVAEKNP
jgi:hypothetical protein